MARRPVRLVPGRPYLNSAARPASQDWGRVEATPSAREWSARRLGGVLSGQALSCPHRKVAEFHDEHGDVEGGHEEAGRQCALMIMWCCPAAHSDRRMVRRTLLRR